MLTPGLIRETRERLGDTQAAFAERLRVNQSTVCRWECGTLMPSGPATVILERLIAEAVAEQST